MWEWEIGRELLSGALWCWRYWMVRFSHQRVRSANVLTEHPDCYCWVWAWALAADTHSGWMLQAVNRLLLQRPEISKLHYALTSLCGEPSSQRSSWADRLGSDSLNRIHYGVTRVEAPGGARRKCPIIRTYCSFPWASLQNLSWYDVRRDSAVIG
jgi:hypothetical protein